MKETRILDASTERALQATRVSWVGLGVNLLLTGFKYVAGFLGHSGAMVADATHSLSDLITDVAAVVGFRLVAKPIDASHDYGHGKIETLLTNLCGLFLLAAGLFILWGGGTNLYAALFRGEVLPRPGFIAFVAAGISVVSKEVLYVYTIRRARELDSSALVAKAWDHRSDALSSVGTLVGIGGALFLGDRFRILDPLAAVVVSYFIIRVSLPLIRESLDELLEASLDEEREEQIRSLICSVPGIRECHGLRTRKIGCATAVEAHVMVDRSLSMVEAHDMATRAEQTLEEGIRGQLFVNLHVEPLPEPGRPHREGRLSLEPEDDEGGDAP